jgi:hypothetical protein
MELDVFQQSSQQLAAGLFFVFCCLQFYEALYEVKRGLMYKPFLLLCPSVTKYQRLISVVLVLKFGRVFPDEFVEQELLHVYQFSESRLA